MENMFDALQEAVNNSYPDISGVFESMAPEDEVLCAFEAVLFNSEASNSLDPSDPEDLSTQILLQAAQFDNMIAEALREADGTGEDGIDPDLGEDLDTEDFEYAMGPTEVFEGAMSQECIDIMNQLDELIIQESTLDSKESEDLTPEEEDLVSEFDDVPDDFYSGMVSDDDDDLV